MPLTADSVVQEATGSTPGADATSTTVTLPAGTTAGSTVLAAINSVTAQGTLTLPTGFVIDVSTGTSTGTLANYVLVRKSSVAAGETSWTFSGAGASQWAWWVGEVTGLDPDPLDASSQLAGTSVTAGATVTRSTGTTSANPGTDTLVLACFGGAASTGAGMGTFTSYTSGFTGRAQATSGGTGTDSSRLVAVASKLSGGATTGPFESTGSYTAGSSAGSIYGMIAAYRAADSPIVNPLTWTLGFEYGTHNGMGGTLGLTAYASVSGTVGTDVIVQASSARAAPSVYGCRLVASAASVYLNASSGTHFPSTVKSAALSMNVRVVSGSGTVVVVELWPTTGVALQLVYDVPSARYGLRWGASGTTAWQAGTTALGAWVWVDLGTAFGAATRHADWRLETAPGTYSPQPSPADLTGQTAASTGYLRIGGTTAQTATMDVDDVVASVYPSPYPLGPHTIQVARVDPAGIPTVNGTVGNFALVTNNATGATLTAGTLTAARDAIDELPPTISTASDGVVQTAVATGDYLQFPMTDVTVGAAQVVAAVRVIAPLISTTGSGAGNLGIRGWDGTTETALITVNALTPGSSTTVSNTVPPTATAMWNPPGGWTPTKLAAAALRVGYSSDATPDMGVHALYLEVALRPALTGRQISVEGDLFTVDVMFSPYSSASVSYGVTSNDPDRGATFSYSVAGVPQTPVYVPATTASTVPVAADVFGDVSDVSLVPDPAP